MIGLKEILRAQQAFNQRYQLAENSPDHSPLKQGTDEYLLELLTGHEQDKFDAVMRLRECFALTRRTHSRRGRSGTAQLRWASSWRIFHPREWSPPQRQLYLADTGSWTRTRTVYSNLLQTTGDDVPHLFIEAIAQAYAEALRKQRSQALTLAGRLQLAPHCFAAADRR